MLIVLQSMLCTVKLLEARRLNIVSGNIEKWVAQWVSFPNRSASSSLKQS